MARRSNRRPAPQQATKLIAEPVAPAPEPADTPPAEPPKAPDEPVAQPNAPFAGRGDHDGNGRTGGVAPAPTAAAFAPPSIAPREKTLHELNQEAWAADKAHREARRAAEAAYAEHVAPKLRGVPRGRMQQRRIQKPVRAPVTE